MTARFISGIYNHCNRWCERCRYTDRCLVFAQIQHYDAVAAGLPSRNPIDDLGPPTPEAEAFLRELDEADQQTSPEALAAYERERHAVEARIAGDDLQQLAKRISRSLWDWSRSRPPGNADVLLAEAQEVVGHYALMLDVKVHRALHGYYEQLLIGDRDMYEADSLPTAKVALLAIDSLQSAVEALALADPADAILRDAFADLPVLKSMLDGRFPGARLFVRDGLDGD